MPSLSATKRIGKRLILSRYYISGEIWIFWIGCTTEPFHRINFWEIYKARIHHLIGCPINSENPSFKPRTTQGKPAKLQSKEKLKDLCGMIKRIQTNAEKATLICIIKDVAINRSIHRVFTLWMEVQCKF